LQLGDISELSEIQNRTLPNFLELAPFGAGVGTVPLRFEPRPLIIWFAGDSTAI
jgi:hypothetical protein